MKMKLLLLVSLFGILQQTDLFAGQKAINIFGPNSYDVYLAEFNDALTKAGDKEALDALDKNFTAWLNKNKNEIEKALKIGFVREFFAEKGFIDQKQKNDNNITIQDVIAVINSKIKKASVAAPVAPTPVAPDAPDAPDAPAAPDAPGQPGKPNEAGASEIKNNIEKLKESIKKINISDIKERVGNLGKSLYFKEKDLDTEIKGFNKNILDFEKNLESYKAPEVNARLRILNSAKDKLEEFNNWIHGKLQLQIGGEEGPKELVDDLGGNDFKTLYNGFLGQLVLNNSAFTKYKPAGAAPVQPNQPVNVQRAVVIVPGIFEKLLLSDDIDGRVFSLTSIKTADEATAKKLESLGSQLKNISTTLRKKLSDNEKKDLRREADIISNKINILFGLNNLEALKDAKLEKGIKENINQAFKKLLTSLDNKDVNVAALDNDIRSQLSYVNALLTLNNIPALLKADFPKAFGFAPIADLTQFQNSLIALLGRLDKGENLEKISLELNKLINCVKILSVIAAEENPMKTIGFVGKYKTANCATAAKPMAPVKPASSASSASVAPVVGPKKFVPPTAVKPTSSASSASVTAPTQQAAAPKPDEDWDTD